MSKIKSPKKLIEVALPLDDINAACAHEKQPGIGAHPRGLHLWWARRPLPAARAVIFSQMVNDPSETVSGDKRLRETQLKIQTEREKLFDIIRDLVKWENTNNESVLRKARKAIQDSWRFTCELNKNHPNAKELFNPEILPGFHDPFAGGGAIPLEGQRLGLESYATDLNPIPLVINKAMIEVPCIFNGKPPIGPVPKERKQSKCFDDWSGSKGLAEDVLRYGSVVLDRVKENIGNLYPEHKISEDEIKRRPDLIQYTEKSLKVLTWIWVRTVNSPSPAHSSKKVPLCTTFILSSKKGKEAFVEPIIEEDEIRFIVRTGEIPASAKKGTKTARGANFTCLYSGAPISPSHIKEESKAGRLGATIIGVVCEAKRGKLYTSPTKEMVDLVESCVPSWKPDINISGTSQYLGCKPYGLEKFSDLFNKRQLVALEEFVTQVNLVKKVIFDDAVAKGMPADSNGLNDGGSGAKAYSEAVALYLSLAIDRLADYNSAVATWKPSGEQVMQTFKRQAIQMTWDFPCLLYTSPSPRDQRGSRMPSSA